MGGMTKDEIEYVDDFQRRAVEKGGVPAGGTGGNTKWPGILSRLAIAASRDGVPLSRVLGEWGGAEEAPPEAVTPPEAQPDDLPDLPDMPAAPAPEPEPAARKAFQVTVRGVPDAKGRVYAPGSVKATGGIIGVHLGATYGLPAGNDGLASITWTGGGYEAVLRQLRGEISADQMSEAIAEGRATVELDGSVEGNEGAGPDVTVVKSLEGPVLVITTSPPAPR